MARTAITPSARPKYTAPSPTANSLDVVFVTGTGTDGFSVLVGSRTLLLVNNANGSSQTFTIDSVPDYLGRVGDIGPYTLGTLETAAIMLPAEGFLQGDATVSVDVSHNDVHVYAIEVP